MATILVVLAESCRRSYVLKTGADMADLGVECLCEKGGLVYNAMTYAAWYCNISLNKPEKKKKPCDTSLAGLSQGLRPIGLNLLAITSNNTVIIRDGQGLSPLLSSILAPSPHFGGMHGNCFGSRFLRKLLSQLSICLWRSVLAGRHKQAVDYRLFGDCTYRVTAKQKGRMRQHPTFEFSFLLTLCLRYLRCANTKSGVPVEGGV